MRICLTYFVEANSPWSYGCFMQKGEMKVFTAEEVPFAWVNYNHCNNQPYKCCFTGNKVFIGPDWGRSAPQEAKTPFLIALAGLLGGAIFLWDQTSVNTWAALTQTTPSVVWYLRSRRATQSSRLGFSCKQENKATNFSSSHRWRLRRNLNT